jgi:type IV pilus assembly protein PilF
VIAVRCMQVVAGFCLVLGCVAGAQAQNFNSNNFSNAQSNNDGQDQVARTPNRRAQAKIHTELGSLYFQQGNMAVALEELRIALLADPAYYPAFTVRGLVHAYLKEHAQAEADFKRAMDLAPNDPGVNNNYGWYLCETGRERDSIRYFLNAVKNPLYPTPDRAYTNAGACALKSGDLVGAETYLNQALRLAQDGAAPARVQMALLYYRRGLLEESRRLLSEALKIMEPPTAQALWLGIRVERKLGNKVVEGSYATQLRGRYPDSPEYQDFLNGKFND